MRVKTKIGLKCLFYLSLPYILETELEAYQLGYTSVPGSPQHPAVSTSTVLGLQMCAVA